MAHTTAAQEEEEAGSGSRPSRARRRRQRRRTAAVTSATRSSSPPKERSKKRKRAAKRNTVEHKEEEEEASASPVEEEVAKLEPQPPPKSSRPRKTRSKRRKRATKSNTLEEEEVSASPAAEEASSAVSSPLRRPYIARSVIDVDSSGREILQPFIEIDPSIISAHQELKGRYFAKQDRQLKLPSLDQNVPCSCLLHPRLLPVRASATKTVLQIAKVVLSLSSSLNDLPLAQSSGFLIDWDADSKIGTILTSALLIRLKSPSVDEWLARDDYAPHAKVCVHLPDKVDTTVPAELVHYDKYYNIAVFEISIDLSAQIPPLSSEVNCAQEVLVLGRDKSRNLSINHGSVQYMGPGDFKRHYHMFVSCGIKEPAIGGPVVNFDGGIVGMASHSQMAFIPSSIILKCLHMWKKFEFFKKVCIPRLHIGMKFSAIIFLDPAHIEKISRKCGLDAGLVVIQVSEGSAAETLGIRAGDIIKYWNGEKISTTVELENFLLCLCEEHLSKGNKIGSNVDLLIDILHVRKDSNNTIKLPAKVSNEVEIVEEGTYAVTPRDCSPEHYDDEVYGEEASRGIDDHEVCGTKGSPSRKHA